MSGICEHGKSMGEPCNACSELLTSDPAAARARDYKRRPQWPSTIPPGVPHPIIEENKNLRARVEELEEACRKAIDHADRTGNQSITHRLEVALGMRTSE